MPDFNAKMHQNWFWLGLHPRSRWGSLQHSPDPLAGFNGPTSKGREGEGKRGSGGEGALDLSASSFWQSWLYGPERHMHTHMQHFPALMYATAMILT